MRVQPGLVEYQITIGKVPSLNQFYAGGHWMIRKKAKDKFAAEVSEQLDTYDKVVLKTLNVRCASNYRYDLDNSILAVKFALDAFRRWGGIEDDSTKFLDKIIMVHDPTVEKATAKITLSGLAK